MNFFCEYVKKSNSNQLELLNEDIYKMNRENDEYWTFMIENCEIPDNKILDNINNIEVSHLLKRQKLSNNILTNENFLKIITEEELWDNILKDQKLNNNILEKYIELFPKLLWENIFKYQNISIDFMEKYEDKLQWDLISANQFMTLEFIVKNRDNIIWNLLGENVKLEFLFNDAFIELFSEKDILDIFIWSKNISTKYLIKNLHKFNEQKILDLIEYKKLNIEIIEKILDNYNNNTIYSAIIKNQELELQFIIDNLDKFNLDDILENQKITFDFIKNHFKFIKKLSYNENLDEELLLQIYENKNLFKDSLDWEFISQFGNFGKKSIKVIEQLNKSLILENINVKI